MEAILIGDSIGVTYAPLVAQKLAGMAVVRGPEDNAGHTRHVLANLTAWVIDRPGDVCHLNCGLHDLKFTPEAGHQVPLDEYAANLRTILARLRGGFSGRLIWAMTTPVIDAWHQKVKPFERHEQDVCCYNEAALELMREGGVEVNDLHEVIAQAGPERCLGPDGVHMNEHGNELLAEAVARAILSPATQ